MIHVRVEVERNTKSAMELNNLKNLEKKLYKHLKDRNWHNLRPVDVAKSIMIEGAELLEIFQWENLSLEEIKKDKTKMTEIKKELEDILIYSIEMSVLLGINTEKIILEKLRHVQKKYPAKLMRVNTNKEPGTEDLYWKIKKAYRKNNKL